MKGIVFTEFLEMVEENFGMEVVNDLLAKPVDIQRLIHTLHHWKNLLEERKDQ